MTSSTYLLITISLTAYYYPSIIIKLLQPLLVGLYSPTNVWYQAGKKNNTKLNKTKQKQLFPKLLFKNQVIYLSNVKYLKEIKH